MVVLRVIIRSIVRGLARAFQRVPLRGLSRAIVGPVLLAMARRPVAAALVGAGLSVVVVSAAFLVVLTMVGRAQRVEQERVVLQQALAEQGFLLYETHCVSCHGDRTGRDASWAFPPSTSTAARGTAPIGA